MTARSDADVIARSRERGEEFQAIFERHAASIVRYLRLRVGDDLAEELTAETFAQAFRVRTRYSPQHISALPWLYGIAGNLVRMHWRSEERRLRAYAKAAGMRESITPGADDLSLYPLTPSLSDSLLALRVARSELRRG